MLLGCSGETLRASSGASSAGARPSVRGAIRGAGRCRRGRTRRPDLHDPRDLGSGRPAATRRERARTALQDHLATPTVCMTAHPQRCRQSLCEHCRRLCSTASVGISGRRRCIGTKIGDVDVRLEQANTRGRRLSAWAGARRMSISLATALAVGDGSRGRRPFNRSGFQGRRWTPTVRPLTSCSAKLRLIPIRGRSERNPGSSSREHSDTRCTSRPFGCRSNKH